MNDTLAKRLGNRRIAFNLEKPFCILAIGQFNIDSHFALDEPTGQRQHGPYCHLLTDCASQPAPQPVGLAPRLWQRTRIDIVRKLQTIGIHLDTCVIRATIADYDLDPIRNPIVRTQELVVFMASAPAKELAVLRLDPLAIRAEKRWLPLIVTIPIRPPPAGDRIIISLRVTNDPPVRTDPKDKSPIPTDTKASALPVWITHGYEQAIIAP